MGFCLVVFWVFPVNYDDDRKFYLYYHVFSSVWKFVLIMIEQLLQLSGFDPT